MKQATVFPFHHPQYDAITTPRGLLRLLIATLCLSLAQPFSALAQTNSSAPLPPAAQEALNKGIIAAKVPDYLLAIRFFEDARKIAPAAPVTYLNLGLAESRIPGRELRAMAWFAAYLAAYPDAPNAAAVREQIAVLDVRNQSNTSRFLKTAQDAVGQLPRYDKIDGLQRVAKLWAKASDITAALRVADLIEDGPYKSEQQTNIQAAIAGIQIETGDIAGAKKTLATALKTADLIQSATQKSWSQSAIAQLQIKAGDIAGAHVTLVAAQKNANLIERQYGDDKSSGHQMTAEARLAVAKAQIHAGDHAGAQRTLAAAQKAAGLIDASASLKAFAQRNIAEAQANSGDIAGAQNTLASAQKTAGLIQDPLEKRQAQHFQTSAQRAIVEALIKVKEFAGALKSIESIDDVNFKNDRYGIIAVAQAKAGDFADAQKTAELIPIEYFKRVARSEIAAIQAKAGNTNTPNQTRPSTSDTQPPIQPVTQVSDWHKILDDGDKSNDCPLNTAPFLDLAGYLKSFPPSDNPQQVFESLHYTAWKIVKAQNVIAGMLKQQAKK
ncbi:MAG: hypothetical protein AABY73_10485 [Pseudomonadota bacterium]